MKRLLQILAAALIIAGTTLCMYKIVNKFQDLRCTNYQKQAEIAQKLADLFDTRRLELTNIVARLENKKADTNVVFTVDDQIELQTAKEQLIKCEDAAQKFISKRNDFQKKADAFTAKTAK